jgi:hypothetical protein
MGTRSVIGVMHVDVCKAVYCHWDGYLEHNGRILQKDYDSAKANHLVALGDISSLKEDIGEKHEFDGYNRTVEEKERVEHMTTFYGRDRDEKGCEFKSFMDFESLVEYVDSCAAEFCYIMKDGVWFMFDDNDRTLRELATELEKVAV